MAIAHFKPALLLALLHPDGDFDDDPGRGAFPTIYHLRQLGAFGGDADDAQPVHPRSRRTSRGEFDKPRAQCIGTAQKQGRIHVGMRTAIDVADEAGFGIGGDFQLQRADGQITDFLKGRGPVEITFAG